MTMVSGDRTVTGERMRLGRAGFDPLRHQLLRQHGEAKVGHRDRARAFHHAGEREHAGDQLLGEARVGGLLVQLGVGLDAVARGRGRTASAGACRGSFEQAAQQRAGDRQPELRGGGEEDEEH